MYSNKPLAPVIFDYIREHGPVDHYVITAGCGLAILPEQAIRCYLKGRDRGITKRTVETSEQIRLGRRTLVLHALCGMHFKGRIIRAGYSPVKTMGGQKLSLWKVNGNGKGDQT